LHDNTIHALIAANGTHGQNSHLPSDVGRIREVVEAGGDRIVTGRAVDAAHDAVGEEEAHGLPSAQRQDVEMLRMTTCLLTHYDCGYGYGYGYVYGCGYCSAMV
jgi:hypothetical protein